MSNQWGRNGGIVGLWDFPDFNAKFETRLFRWSSRQGGTTRPRRGRGGGVYRTVRWLMSAGTIAGSGKVRIDGWPAPDQFRGAVGTLTVIPFAGRSIVYPVIVTEIGFDFDEK